MGKACSGRSLLIDAEEDKYVRAVLVGMLKTDLRS
jgi:hypothetical protein